MRPTAGTVLRGGNGAVPRGHAAVTRGIHTVIGMLGTVALREMDFLILGPLELRNGSEPIRLTGARQRGLLALLLLHRNEVLGSERLIDELWGESPPPTAAKALQNAVLQVRRALGEHAGRAADRARRLRAARRARASWTPTASSSSTRRAARPSTPATTRRRRSGCARRSRSGADRRSPTSPTRASLSRRSRGWRTSASQRSRTASRPTSRWAATPRSCPSSRPRWRATRCASASAPSS